MNLVRIINECLTLIESLEVEKQTYTDPENEFYIDVDPRDPDTGVITYLGYEFPIVKTLKQGGVSYFVGDVRSGKTFNGDKNSAFMKVKDAVMNGKVNPKAAVKNDRSIERDIPKTVTVDTQLGPKEYIYVPPGEVDDFITKMYEMHGAGYKEVLKRYATDRPSGNLNNPYIPLNQTARQNVYLYKSGSKDKAINYKTF
jgi:hypothetical protein